METVQPQTEPATLLLLKFHRLPAFWQCNVMRTISKDFKHNESRRKQFHFDAKAEGKAIASCQGAKRDRQLKTSS